MAKLILHNANVITLDERDPKAELVVVEDGIIRAVAANDRLNEYRSKGTRLLDCGGKTVLPGFIDAHFHFHAFAESFLSLDLSPRNHVRTIADIQTKIREKVSTQAPGEWIRAKGYNEFYLSEKRHPDRWDLDKATSEQPVKLTHRSGHAHVLNSPALKLVGITRETADPPNGLIDRDLDTAEPTGLLYEMGDFLAKRIPPPDPGRFDRAIKKADRKLLSLGITSIHDASAGNGPDRWESFQSAVEKLGIKCRITMMVGLEAFDTVGMEAFESPVDPDRLRPGGVKIILDESTGSLYPPQEVLNEKVLDIHRSGQQAVIHAIEEPAIDAACTAIEFAMKQLPRADPKHRIEHCSVCPPGLARRLAAAGITVVTQPSFLYFNGDRYRQTLSAARIKNLYPFKTLLHSGVAIAGSSDCPIVPPDPFFGIYSAATRTCETEYTLQEDEKLPVLDALRMMTIWAATACRQASRKGSISPGKLADMILVDRDPTRVPTDEIRDIRVEKTFIGGEVF